MKKKFLFIILSTLLFSCDFSKKTIQEKDNKELVVIIKNKLGISTNIGSGISITDFSRLDYNTDKRIDTMWIDVERYKKLYVRNENDFKHVIFTANDTLNVEVFENRTNIYYSNRLLRKYDTIKLENIYKVNAKKELKHFKNQRKKYLTLDVNSNRYTINRELIFLDSINYRNLNIYSNNIYKRKKEILASLLNKDLISKPNYNYEVSMLESTNIRFLFDNYKLTSDNYYKDKIIEYVNNKDLFNDGFINYSIMNQLIKTIVLEGNFDKTETNLSYDYKKAIKLLPLFFNGDNLQILWEFCLYSMADQRGSFSELIECLNNYKSKFPQAEFIEIFNEKYIVDLKKKNFNSDNVTLLDLKSKQVLLKNIIKENKGKLIYIDFWASWCAPCIATMPASKKLSKAYKSKDIVFIYVSIDENIEKWQLALNAEKLPLTKNNLLATNYPNVSFYKELNLITIPRYLLYDKKGELVHQNAPRPSSIEIRELFDKYLKE